MNGVTGQVPDYPSTRLAMRTWQFDKTGMTVRSLNAPQGRKSSWMAKAMASPAGAWPHGSPLAANCPLTGERAHEDPVPGAECSCGIYATTDLDVINGYLSRTAPVLGIVELGGRVVPATQGYRAAYARVAAVLLIDDALTESHTFLRKLAGAYRVPAVVPHSADPEDYREIAGLPTLAAEAEAWLRQIGGLQ